MLERFVATEATATGSVVLAMAFNSDKHNTMFVSKLIVIGFVVTEAVCFGVVYAILKVLRRNVGKFSKKTYRIHVQLTLLVVIQVFFDQGFM